MSNFHACLPFQILLLCLLSQLTCASAELGEPRAAALIITRSLKAEAKKRTYTASKLNSAWQKDKEKRAGGIPTFSPSFFSLPRWKKNKGIGRDEPGYFLIRAYDASARCLPPSRIVSSSAIYLLAGVNLYYLSDDYTRTAKLIRPCLSLIKLDERNTYRSIGEEWGEAISKIKLKMEFCKIFVRFVYDCLIILSFYKVSAYKDLCKFYSIYLKSISKFNFLQLNYNIPFHKEISIVLTLSRSSQVTCRSRTQKPTFWILAICLLSSPLSILV